MHLLSFNSLPDSHYVARAEVMVENIKTFNSLPDSHEVMRPFVDEAVFSYFQFPAGFSHRMSSNNTNVQNKSIFQFPTGFSLSSTKKAAVLTPLALSIPYRILT